MRRFIFLCALLAGLALLACAPAGQAVGAAEENDIQKIVYLGDRGPILIALHLRIDGELFRARHQKFINELFSYLDRNGDGVLSRSESATAPTAAMLRSPLGLIARGRVAGGTPLIPGEAGKITRQELTAYYRKTGLPPFQISDAAMQPVIVRGAPVNDEPTAEELTDRLFKLLDTDKDGKLSRKELEAAPEILARLDVDEDEMITPAELMGEAGARNDYGIRIVNRPRIQTVGEFRPIHVVAGGGEDEALAKALMARYGKSGEESLTASRLGLSNGALAVLDRDRDGKLSLVELARFADKPADVTLTVSLGNRDGKPLMTLTSDKALPAGVKAKSAGDVVSLELGTTRLDLTTGESAALRLPDVRAQLKAQFRQADVDNKGYLVRQTGRNAGFLGAIFDAVDRDGDGKITEKELLAYYDRMQALRKVLDRSCVSLVVSNQGKGLFDMLDTDGDGRLSVRELRNATKLLSKLDPDGDGKLARRAVPRHHRGELVLGPSGGGDSLGRAVVVRTRREVRDVRGAPARGPVWFQKMDRNRDGDVSRKEFIGTDEQFREIDADGDGLISLEEAERYDRRKRAEKE